MTDDDTIHRVGLMFGTFQVAILLMVEVANQEKWNPRALIMANTMNEQERRSNTSVDLTGNRIHHAGGVDNGIKPESLRHLLFGKIGACHVNHDLPMGFNKTIRQLVLGGRSNHLGRIVNELFTDSPSEELRVTVAVETTSQGTSRGKEETKSRENAVG